MNLIDSFDSFRKMKMVVDHSFCIMSILEVEEHQIVLLSYHATMRWRIIEIVIGLWLWIGFYILNYSWSIQCFKFRTLDTDNFYCTIWYYVVIIFIEIDIMLTWYLNGSSFIRITEGEKKKYDIICLNFYTHQPVYEIN